MLEFLFDLFFPMNLLTAALLAVTCKVSHELARFSSAYDSLTSRRLVSRRWIFLNLSIGWAINVLYLFQEYGLRSLAPSDTNSRLHIAMACTSSVFSSFFFLRATIPPYFERVRYRNLVALLALVCSVTPWAWYLGGFRVPSFYGAIPAVMYDIVAISLLAYRLQEHAPSSYRFSVFRRRLLLYSLIGYASLQPVYIYLIMPHEHEEAHQSIGQAAFSIGFLLKIMHLLGMVSLTRAILEGAASRDARLRSQKGNLERQARFISQLAHELKTPTAYLRIALDTLAAAIKRRGNVRASLDEVSTIATRIDAIVDGAWNYLVDSSSATRIPKEKRFPRSIRKIPNLIEQAYISIKSTMWSGEDAKRVTLEGRYAKDIAIRCVPSEMIQVFENLIKNSYEAFGESGGRIVVRVRRSVTDRREKSDAQAEVQFCDDGHGILNGLGATIFEDGVTTKKNESGKHGHGLSVVKDLVQKNQGTVELMPAKKKQGACFLLRFPLAGTQPRQIPGGAKIRGPG